MPIHCLPFCTHSPCLTGSTGKRERMKGREDVNVVMEERARRLFDTFAENWGRKAGAIRGTEAALQALPACKPSLV